MMTELEKLEARIEAVDTAVANVKMAMGVDRKLGHEKHVNGHYTKALQELTSIQTQLNTLRVRVETVGR
jgi:uncharacterized protein (DUF3084 family)